LSALAAERGIVAAALYDRTGTVFAKYPDTVPDDLLPASPAQDGHRFEHSHLILFQPVINDGRRLGTLYLKSNLGAMYQRLAIYGGVVVLASVLSCLVAFALSNRLQRHISRPILALADSAKTISERQDYSVRAAKFEDDELGQLTDAFNHMLAQIQRQDTALRDAKEEVRKSNRELEKRVAQRTAQLEMANKELEAFSYSVSHDLRAPLRHTSGFLELLQKHAGSSLDTKSQRYLNMISESATQMACLIDDLLAFSRTGRAEMRTRSVNLDELVKETIKNLKQETEGRDIVWKIAPLPEVQADPSLLHQVLVNLISNGLKYSRTRTRGEIEIGCRPDHNGEHVIFIRDNGVGFDMKYANKLFGVFQRLHDNDEFEGTGIGLANVQRIINRHGGRTWAEGIVDGGATFYFSLPKSQPTTL
jgi:signal transduction histidine kinase